MFFNLSFRLFIYSFRSCLHFPPIISFIHLFLSFVFVFPYEEEGHDTIEYSFLFSHTFIIMFILIQNFLFNKWMILLFNLFFYFMHLFLSCFYIPFININIYKAHHTIIEIHNYYFTAYLGESEEDLGDKNWIPEPHHQW